jgi:UDP-N-acetylmuramate--alanine ligase
MKAIQGQNKEIITFGFTDKNDYYPANIRHISGACSEFDLVHQGEVLCKITINVPGDHNIINAVAASIAAIKAGVSPAQIAESIVSFTGAGRRFEVLGEVNDITIADDYAHHPAELKVTLEAAQKMNFNSVWAVFQPFTYSRTAMLLNDFAEALSIADHVVLSEIMGSREKNTYNIYSKDLAEKIDGCVWFNTFDEICEYVLSHAKEGDLVITLGCGDIYKAAKKMLAVQ